MYTQSHLGCKSWVYGFGFWVQGLGLRVQGLGFRSSSQRRKLQSEATHVKFDQDPNVRSSLASRLATGLLGMWRGWGP